MRVQFPQSAPSKMHTIDKGEVARYSAAAHFMERGFIVSVPLTENSSYDLIVESENKLYRTQVKKANYDEGVLKISLHTGNHNTKVNGTIRKYISKEIDWLIGVDTDKNKYYLIDYSTGEYDNRNSIWLRLDPPQRKRKNIKYAKDYEF